MDADGLVHWLPAFLNESEVQHLRAIVAGDARFAAAYHSAEFFRPWEPRADAVTSAIETRIGELTGLPPSEHDSPLRIAVNRPWGGEAEGTPSVRNLHHDSHERPRRVAVCLAEARPLG